VWQVERLSDLSSIRHATCLSSCLHHLEAYRGRNIWCRQSDFLSRALIGRDVVLVNRIINPCGHVPAVCHTQSDMCDDLLDHRRCTPYLEGKAAVLRGDGHEGPSEGARPFLSLDGEPDILEGITSLVDKRPLGLLSFLSTPACTQNGVKPHKKGYDFPMTENGLAERSQAGAEQHAGSRAMTKAICRLATTLVTSGVHHFASLLRNASKLLLFAAAGLRWLARWPADSRGSELHDDETSAEIFQTVMR
jgi:hypothetical protein